MTSTIRWGICATGWISHSFCLDLLISPSTRGVNLTHVVQAVASRSARRAGDFVNTLWTEAKPVGVTPDSVSLHGDYEDLFADPDVDVIFIGSPPSHHFVHAHAALSAGKSVLLEKPFVTNAAQAQVLINLAREKSVFLMEGLWTRFQPISYKVEEVIKSGVIGEIRSVDAEHGVDFRSETQPREHRMLRKDLAGGALLDIAPYPWTWLSLLLVRLFPAYPLFQQPSLTAAILPTSTQTPPPSASLDRLTIPKLVASVTFDSTGVDNFTKALIQFPQPDGKIIPGSLCANLTQHPRKCVIVHGSKGYLEIFSSGSCPPSFAYAGWASDEDYASGRAPSISESLDYSSPPGGISGLAWEADEVAHCLLEGRKESERWPLRETLRQMQIFDEIRRQGEITFPEDVETTSIEKGLK
ncbi:NAD(P)-binding protein [Meredithblackwellia eburnea MCA 4105]